MNHYRLLDAEVPERWYLQGLWDSTGIRLDARECRYGNSLELSPSLLIHSDSGELVEARYPLTTKLYQSGTPLDFTFDSSDMPVVTAAVAEVVRRLAPTSVQLIPVNVENWDEQYYILNVTALIDAVDRDQSNAEYWREGEGRPDKVGKPKIIYGLVIDPLLAKDQPLFRVAGWEIALIASESVRTAFETHRFRGAEFLPV